MNRTRKPNHFLQKKWFGSNESSLSASVDSDDFEMFLKQVQKEVIPDACDQACVIESFDGIKRLSKEETILRFWQNFSSPDLQQAAFAILSVPCTQVSVERTFSTLKFILSDLRASIDPDLLEDILLINLNNVT